MLAQLQIENRVEGGKFKGGIQKHLSSPSYAPQLARLTIKVRPPAQKCSTSGRRPNGFLGLSLNDRNIIFLVILLDKSVSVG